MLVKLVLSVLTPKQQSTTDELAEIEYLNSTITARTPESRRKRGAEAGVDAVVNFARPLTAHAVRRNVVTDYYNIIESCRMWFMPGWGCIHLRSEHRLSTPGYVQPTELSSEDEPCSDQCCFCSGEYKKYMLPVVPEGALKFLRSAHLDDCMRHPVSVANCGELVGALSKERNGDWKPAVFGIKTVQVYNIVAFYFQLLASKLLGFEWSNVRKEVHYVLLKDDQSKFNYNTMAHWSGFEFREARHFAKTQSYAEMKRDPAFCSLFEN